MLTLLVLFKSNWTLNQLSTSSTFFLWTASSAWARKEAGLVTHVRVYVMLYVHSLSVPVSVVRAHPPRVHPGSPVILVYLRRHRTRAWMFEALPFSFWYSRTVLSICFLQKDPSSRGGRLTRSLQKNHRKMVVPSRLTKVTTTQQVEWFIRQPTAVQLNQDNPFLIKTGPFPN